MANLLPGQSTSNPGSSPLRSPKSERVAGPMERTNDRLGRFRRSAGSIRRAVHNATILQNVKRTAPLAGVGSVPMRPSRAQRQPGIAVPMACTTTDTRTLPWPCYPHTRRLHGRALHTQPPPALTAIGSAPVSSQPGVASCCVMVTAFCSSLRADLTVPLYVSGCATSRLDGYRLPSVGISHRPLCKHPPDCGHVLPILKPPVSLTTHRGQELRPEVVMPPDHRVVVHGHPHADRLPDGKETVAQHVVHRLLQRSVLGPGLGGNRFHTGWQWKGDGVARRLQSWVSLAHFFTSLAWPPHAVAALGGERRHDRIGTVGCQKSFASRVHLTATLDLGRREGRRRLVDRGSMTGILDSALAEISADRSHPVAVRGPKRSSAGHRMTKGVAVPTVPPGHGVEVQPLVRTDGLTNGQKAVRKDVVELCSLRHERLLMQDASALRGERRRSRFGTLPPPLNERAPECLPGAGAVRCAWRPHSPVAG